MSPFLSLAIVGFLYPCFVVGRSWLLFLIPVPHYVHSTPKKPEANDKSALTPACRGIEVPVGASRDYGLLPDIFQTVAVYIKMLLTFHR